MAAEEKPNIPTGNFRFIHLVTLVVVVAIVGLVGWTYYQKSQLESQVTDLDSKIADTQAQLDEFRKKELEPLIVAQQTVERVEASSVWSDIVANLLSITPANIFYTSYAASRTDEMTLSVLTDTYTSAAELVSTLNAQEDYSDVFVSSLTKGSDQEGADVVSFGVTFNVQ